MNPPCHTRSCKGRKLPTNAKLSKKQCLSYFEVLNTHVVDEVLNLKVGEASAAVELRPGLLKLLIDS